MRRILAVVLGCLAAASAAHGASKPKPLPTPEEIQRLLRAVQDAKEIRCRDLTEKHKHGYLIIKSRDRFERDMCLLVKLR